LGEDENRALDEYPKSIKKELRRLSGVAHERELDRKLAPLAESFRQWSEGTLDSGSLALLVHDCGYGVLRDLAKFYNDAPVSVRVGRAVAYGLLADEDIPEEVWPYIEDAISFYRSDPEGGGEVGV
jgi:hypothetical protein